MLSAFLLFLSALNSAFALSTEIRCDSSGHISEISDAQNGKTEFNPSINAKLSAETVRKYCEDLSSCQQLLGTATDSFDDVGAVMKKISSSLPAAGSDKMPLVSEIKRLQNSLDRCRAHAKDQAPKKINIDYPETGPNKAIRSANYDYENIKKLIQLALLNGVDPFLVLSISAVESPLLVNKSGVAGYEHGYGILPIDGLPLFDRIGCAYKPKAGAPNKYATTDQVTEFKRLVSQRKNVKSNFSSAASKKIYDFIPNIVGTIPGEGVVGTLNKLMNSKDCKVDGVPEAAAKQFCNTPGMREAAKEYINSAEMDQKIDEFRSRLKSENHQALLELSVKYDDGVAIAVVPPSEVKTFHLPWGGDKSANLCTESRPYSHGQPAWMASTSEIKKDQCCVKVDGLVEGDNVEREFLNYMAVDFVKNKIKFPKGAVDETSFNIQPFNGVGCIGCTEGLQNNCLNGLHMGTRPYYGARVADLMINSMMMNPEIRKMVAESSAELGENVKSAFCQKNGPGPITLDTNTFLAQQKKFLLNGSDGKITIANKEILYKARMPGGGIGAPSSPGEKDAFRDMEMKRRKLCETYFN